MMSGDGRSARPARSTHTLATRVLTGFEHLWTMVAEAVQRLYSCTSSDSMVIYSRRNSVPLSPETMLVVLRAVGMEFFR